jgi:hypothetical protein
VAGAGAVPVGHEDDLQAAQVALRVFGVVIVRRAPRITNEYLLV